MWGLDGVGNNYKNPIWTKNLGQRDRATCMHPALAATQLFAYQIVPGHTCGHFKLTKSSGICGRGSTRIPYMCESS